MITIQSTRTWLNKSPKTKILWVIFAVFILLGRALIYDQFYWLANIVLTAATSSPPFNSQIAVLTSKISFLTAIVSLGYLIKLFWAEIKSVFAKFRRREKSLAVWFSWLWLLAPGAGFYLIGIKVLLVTHLLLNSVGLLTVVFIEFACVLGLLYFSAMFGRLKKGLAVTILLLYEGCVILLSGFVYVAGEFDFLKYADMLWGANYDYVFRTEVLVPFGVFLILTPAAILTVLSSLKTRKGSFNKLVLSAFAAISLMLVRPVGLTGELLVFPQTSLKTLLMMIDANNVQSVIGGHLPRFATDYFKEKPYKVYQSKPAALATTIQEYNLFDPLPLDSLNAQVLESDSTEIPKFNKIILLTVESYSLVFTGYNNPPCNQSITPFMDSLMTVYPSAALWTSAAPTLYGLSALFSSHPNADLLLENNYPNSYVKLLSQNGYRTPFLRSSSERYANEHVLFKRAGYNEMFGRESFEKMPRFDNNISGWGLEDAFVLQFAGDYLENHRDEKVFMHILPADTHAPYGREEYSNDYPELPDGLACEVGNEALIRSFYREDVNIKRFYQRMINENLLDDETLIIITADHAIGTVYSGEDEPLAQIPVVFISKNPVEGLSLAAPNLSQVDLTPTILNLAGLSPPAGYFGKSLFDSRPRTYLGMYGNQITVREDSSMRKVSIDTPAGEDDELLIKVLNAVIVE